MFSCRKKLLIVRLDAIGDFILWLGAAERLRAAYSDYRITLLGNDIWTEVAQALPFWDEVWPLNRKKFRRNPFYRRSLNNKIRKVKFDIVIQPTYSREFYFGDRVIRSCKVKKRIGFQCVTNVFMMKPYQKRKSDLWYTYLVPSSHGPMMELQRDAEFMSGLLGEKVGVSVPRLPPLGRPTYSFRAAKPYFIIFPGAAWNGRKWPLDRFAAIAEEIVRQTDWECVICGGPGDVALSEEFSKNYSREFRNLAGKTSLSEFVEIVRNAEMVVGNETSVIHIAAAVDTPSVCIMGGGHFGRFLPYAVDEGHGENLPRAVYHHMDCFGCNWLCKYHVKKRAAVPCVLNIEVQDVILKVRDILVQNERLSS